MLIEQARVGDRVLVSTDSEITIGTIIRASQPNRLAIIGYKEGELVHSWAWPLDAVLINGTSNDYVFGKFVFGKTECQALHSFPHIKDITMNKNNVLDVKNVKIGQKILIGVNSAGDETFNIADVASFVEAQALAFDGLNLL